MSAAQASFDAALEPLRRWWGGLAPRERTLVGLGAAALLLLATWTLAVQPAWRTLRDAPARQARLDAQWQAMQRMAEETRELRALPPVARAQAASALKSASDRLGEQGRLSLQGERAVLTLNGASTSQLRAWLAEVRSGARARPVEANLTRGAEGYSGTVVVALPGTP